MDNSVAIMDRRKWLFRLIYVRLIVFSLYVTAHFGFATGNVPLADLAMLVYALSVCWLLIWWVNERYVAQAYAQIIVDLLLITWTVNRTGGVDSYFSSLYFLEIVMSSILLDQRGVFMSATVSSVVHLAHLDLAYFDFLPSMTVKPMLSTLQYIISLNIFGFCAVGFLSNYLAQRWRSAGAELKKSTGQVAFLQAFSDRVIDSMGTGLITSDLEGRINLFN